MWVCVLHPAILFFAWISKDLLVLWEMNVSFDSENLRYMSRKQNY